MRSEAEISRDMAGKTKCCKYRITDASYSGSCEHPSCACNANTVPMHKREQRCEHCRGTGRVTAGEQESGLTERQRVAIQFYTDNPRAAEFDFGKRFDAPGVTVPAPVVSLDECCPRCLRDGMVQRASECKVHGVQVTFICRRPAIGPACEKQCERCATDGARVDAEPDVARLVAAGKVRPQPVDRADLERRIIAAIRRLVDGHAPMRVPADPTDPDLVLADCLALLRASGVAAAPDRPAWNHYGESSSGIEPPDTYGVPGKENGNG